MNKTQSRPILGRRDFLKLLAAAGVTAAGGYSLNTYTPWLDYDGKASQIRIPFEKSTMISMEMLELVRLGDALPQLLLRFGYADPMPSSLRCPVEQVLI